MPTFEIILPAVDRLIEPILQLWGPTNAQVAADRLIDSILREEGPSHQHLAPSHLECFLPVANSCSSGVPILAQSLVLYVPIFSARP